MAERILIVDDDVHVLKALERVLRRDRYEILKAESGEQAIALLQGNEVATIICDQHMPNISGCEVLLQAIELRPHAGRILLTGVQDLHTIMEVINKGQVSQFILKPWEEVTLRQTVRSCVETYCLTRRNQVLETKNKQQHQDLEDAHNTLSRELVVGASIYEKLLVGATPRNTPGFKIEAIAIPSKEIDGDFRTIYQPAVDMLDVVTGDVMGKGLPAALVATSVKMHLMRVVQANAGSKVFSGEGRWKEEPKSLTSVMKSVHDELIESLMEIGFFASLFFARFDLGRRVLSFVDCGSPKPLHYRAIDKSITFLEGESLPVGVYPEDQFHQKECTFELDDLFLFYSDGVTEMKNPSGQLYGVERLEAIIKTNSQLPPKALLHIIRESVLSYGQKGVFDDDLTLVLVKFDPSYQPHSFVEETATFAADLSQLDAVRDFVKKLCHSIPGDAGAFTGQLQLAVNEAFANIVQHSSDDKEIQKVILRGCRGLEGMDIEIRDQGKPFSPEEVPHPNLAGEKDGGFGLFIIQQIADRLVYCPKKSNEEWNSLQIYKSYCEGEKMEFTHQREQQVLIISLEGENLDAKDAPRFKEEMTKLISNERVDNLVFNLRDLQFIDSSGLGSFLSVLRHVNNRGGDLKLACMTKPIRTMFEVVRMHKLFEIFNTTEDAVRSFEG